MPNSTSSVSRGLDFSDLREGIWRLEQELDLLSATVQGVHFWRLVRWALFVTLSNRRAPVSAGSMRFSAKVAHRARSEVEALKAGIASRPWSWAGKVDSILIPFPRKHTIDGQLVDIHSEQVLSDKALGRFLVLERTDASARLSDAGNRFVANRDRFRPWVVMRASLRARALTAEVGLLHARLDEASRRILDTPFPFSVESLCLRIALFETGRRVLRSQLRRTGAKRLFAAWHDQVMFAAAQDLGIETIELQHAAYSTANLHYHFAGSPPVPYFADRILTFGRHWIESVELPGSTRASVAGSVNMARQAARGSAQEQRVLVSSQGPTDWRLFEAVVEAAAAAPQWQFVIRPHPRERLSDYAARLDALGQRLENIRLSDRNEDVYALLRTSRIQIGVASTTLFEGMALGCRTIVFASTGSEVMAEVVGRGDAVLARDAAEIVKLLDTAPLAVLPERYYAPPAPSVAALLS